MFGELGTVDNAGSRADDRRFSRPVLAIVILLQFSKCIDSTPWFHRRFTNAHHHRHDISYPKDGGSEFSLANYPQPCMDEYDDMVYVGVCMDYFRCRALFAKRMKMDRWRRPSLCASNDFEHGRPRVCCAIDDHRVAAELPELADVAEDPHGASATITRIDERPVVPPNDQPPVDGLERCGCTRKPDNEQCAVRTEPVPKGEQITVNLIGGEPVTNPGDFPWMAVLGERHGDDMEWFCGASLITDQHVLTAAHCVETRKVDIVRLGEHDLGSADETPSIDVGAEKISMHEEYKPPVYYNDIALIKLDKKITFSRTVRSICLPMLEAPDLTSKELIIMGWGTVGFGGQSSSVLRFVAIPIVDREKCNTSYSALEGSPRRKYPQGITMDMVCAGAEGKDACQGDSGGPLVHEGVHQVTGDELFTLVGIVSSGIRCGSSEFPGLYTRVDRYLDWIKAKIADDTQ